jgi:hypothetical protein
LVLAKDTTIDERKPTRINKVKEKISMVVKKRPSSSFAMSFAVADLKIKLIMIPILVKIKLFAIMVFIFSLSIGERRNPCSLGFIKKGRFVDHTDNKIGSTTLKTDNNWDLMTECHVILDKIN